jgi:hypothetical protein
VRALTWLGDEKAESKQLACARKTSLRGVVQPIPLNRTAVASCRQSMITDDARLAPAVIMDPRNMPAPDHDPGCGDDSVGGGF